MQTPTKAQTKKTALPSGPKTKLERCNLMSMNSLSQSSSTGKQKPYTPPKRIKIDDPKQFGLWVEHSRLVKGRLSQSQLAALAGCSQGLISMLERGARRQYKFSTMQKIFIALDELPAFNYGLDRKMNYIRWKAVEHFLNGSETNNKKYP